MNQKSLTTSEDLIRAFAGAMDLINPELQDHHRQVAYLSLKIAEEMELSEADRQKVFFGALLHDVGGVIVKREVSLRELESDPKYLARAGASLLKTAATSLPFAEVVEESQTPWERLKNVPHKLTMMHLAGQIVHLADAVSLLLKSDEPPLGQVEHVWTCIHEAGEVQFSPEVMEAFDGLCDKEYIWLDLLYRPDSFLEDMPLKRELTSEEVISFTDFVARIIDFRSPFTAMHSAGVASTAVCLAELTGMTEEECRLMQIAGNLHDIGKLKTPAAILEKPGKLTDAEFRVMKEHVYFTYALLKDIRGFDTITKWAAFHHEKLDGMGYPFHLAAEELTLGSRIMTVADMFSAVAEDRPYRKGMDKSRVTSILTGDVDRGRLSGEIVGLLLDNYDDINQRRQRASERASLLYRKSLECVKGDGSF